jgi:lysozyme family protein
MTTYEEALQFTLGREGGYYAGNEARDPNPTNYGVTQDTYNSYRGSRGLRPVKDIRMTEVEAIYQGYWYPAPNFCAKQGLRLSAITLFDMAINGGPSRASKIMQAALKVDVDGKVGPLTLAALKSVSRSDDAAFASAISWERVRYYVDLAKTPRQRPNLLSWVHRVVLFRERYL